MKGAGVIPSIRLEKIKQFWVVLYRLDSAKKLLDRSERLQECECEAECYRDIEGPKIILSDALKEFEQLLYELECGFDEDEAGGAR